MKVLIVNGYTEGKDIINMKPEKMSKLERRFYEFYMNIKSVNSLDYSCLILDFYEFQ